MPGPVPASPVNSQTGTLEFEKPASDIRLDILHGDWIGERLHDPSAVSGVVNASGLEDLKRVGLRRLLVDVADGRGAYDLWNGLDDMLVEWALDKAGRYTATRFTSVLRPGVRTVLGAALRLVSR